jgi:hypothetical protein
MHFHAEYIPRIHFKSVKCLVNFLGEIFEFCFNINNSICFETTISIGWLARDKIEYFYNLTWSMKSLSYQYAAHKLK